VPARTSERGPWRVEWHTSLDSTNRYTLDAARSGAANGLVVVADVQTAGRGRLGRTWEAPPGSSLLVSVLLRPQASPAQVALITLVLAAVCLLRGRPRVAVAVIGLTAATSLSSQLLKLLLAHPRFPSSLSYTLGPEALPSGHATEAHIVAQVLWRLALAADDTKDDTDIWLEQLMRQAARIAVNRTVAGVHFPVDSAAGQLLGLTLGEYLVHLCGLEDEYTAWEFLGPQFGPSDDFDWRAIYDTTVPGKRKAASFAIEIGDQTATNSLILKWLWERAATEWAA